MTLLRMTHIHARLRATRRAELAPYPATTVRGAVGNALRELSCTADLPSCVERAGPWPRTCNRIAACPYGRLFESMVPVWVDPSTVPRSPPPPYIVSTPWNHDPIELGVGDEVPILVTLLGDARALWPNVLEALRVAAPRIGPLEARGAFALVGLRDDSMVQHTSVTLVPLDPGTHHVGLHFSSPLWIRDYAEPGKRVTMSAFDPAVFTEALASRLLQLLRLYEPDMERPDLGEVAQLARGVRVVEDRTGQIAFARYSRRMDDRVPTEGLVGSVVCSGVDPSVFSLWRMAEAIHVGRNTNFGFGRVTVTPMQAVPA